MSDKSYEGFTYWRYRLRYGAEPALLEKRDKEGDHLPNERAAEPGALREQIIPIPFPTMVGGQVVIEDRQARVRQSEQKPPADWRDAKVEGDTLTCARILPGTRVIETNAPPVAEWLDRDARYEQIDPPGSVRPHKPRQTEASK